MRQRNRAAQAAIEEAEYAARERPEPVDRTWDTELGRAELEAVLGSLEPVWGPSSA